MSWVVLVLLLLRKDTAATLPPSLSLAGPRDGNQLDQTLIETLRIAYEEEGRGLDSILRAIDSLRQRALGLMAAAVALAVFIASDREPGPVEQDAWVLWSLGCLGVAVASCLLIVVPSWKQGHSIDSDAVAQQYNNQKGQFDRILARCIDLRQKMYKQNKRLYNWLRRGVMLAVIALVTGASIWALQTLNPTAVIPEAQVTHQASISHP